MALKKGQEIQLHITEAAFKGKGLAKLNGMAIFVADTTPGDTVNARIIKKKKNYCEAKLLEILEPSPHRIPPKCQHANVCGGCSWQHVPYAKQLDFKTRQVQDHISRIAGLPSGIVKPAIGSEAEFHYRNKMEYSFSTRRWLSEEEIRSDTFIDDSGFAAGLHAPGRFDKILNLNECFLQVQESFQILDFVRAYCIEHDISAYNTFSHSGFMRHLVIRNAHHTPDFMVNLVTNGDQPEIVKSLAEALLARFPFISTIINSINDTKSPVATGRYEHVLFGPGYITDHIGEFSFRIHSTAFFQTNTAQAEILYDIARNYAGLKAGDIVYDLYCGVGTLSLYMSNKAAKIVGIELVDAAIDNAKFNARANKVENVHFIKGDMKDVFTDAMVQEFGRPDVLITDPPRAGMHPDVVRKLCELKIPRIVYVSCESSTLARDLKELSTVYTVEEVQPVDMFPQTYHIESVARLVLN